MAPLRSLQLTGRLRRLYCNALFFPVFLLKARDPPMLATADPHEADTDPRA